MSEGNYLESQYEMIDKLEITENTRVVYQGVEGAFAEQAAANYFGEHVKRFHVDKFEEILTCLEEGKADYGVLPIENSSAGFVSPGPSRRRRGHSCARCGGHGLR